MARKKLLHLSAVLVGAALLSTPVLSQYEKMESRRRVITCNVDGTYTCANEQCELGYCCQIGG